MSLLSLCQEAARLVGEPRPSHVINNKEVGVARLLAFARLEGARLARAFPWQALIKEATLLTLGQEDQGPITIVAPDFDRLVTGSLYNRSRGHRVFGPIEEGRWQRLKASGATAGSGGFRLRGGRLLMLPAPPTGETLAFEYVSTRWIDSDGDGAGDATEFMADTDRILLDNDLVLLGMVWRWLRQNGFAWQSAYAEYEERLREALGRDGGQTALVMDRPAGPVLGAWTPDGGFG